MWCWAKGAAGIVTEVLSSVSALPRAHLANQLRKPSSWSGLVTQKLQKYLLPAIRVLSSVRFIVVREVRGLWPLHLLKER